MIDWTKGNRTEIEIISKISKRAVGLLGGKVLAFSMDLQACHTHGCKLKLVELLDTDDGNFLHDVCGIHQNINRTTGELENCFLPRFALNQTIENISGD